MTWDSRPPQFRGEGSRYKSAVPCDVLAVPLPLMRPNKGLVELLDFRVE